MPSATESRRLARRKDDVEVRPDLADINILLDRSGSMSGDEDNTVEGINKVIMEQQSGEGEALLTLVQFDNEFEVNYEAKPVKDCKFMARSDYMPRGGTHLFASIMRMVAMMDARFAAAPKDAKPGRQMLFIVTDGGEDYQNKEIGWEQLCEVLKNRREQQGWTIVFIGCDEGGIAQAKQAGVVHNNAMQFRKSAHQGRGMKVAMAQASKGISNLRAADYGAYSGQSGAASYKGADGAEIKTSGVAAYDMFDAAAQMSDAELSAAADWKAPDPTKTSAEKDI